MRMTEETEAPVKKPKKPQEAMVIVGQVLKSYGKTIGLDYKTVKEIDPTGIGVVTHHLLHNDEAVRVSLLAKMSGQKDPRSLTVEVPLPLFTKLFQTIRKENGEWKPV
jgi:hypothetical protein